MVSQVTNGDVGMNSKLKNHSHHNHSNLDVPDSLVLRLLWRGFEYTLGLVNWIYFLFAALKSGAFFAKADEKENNLFVIGRDDLWNLSKQPIPGFQHDFFELQDGFQFHYLCNQPQPVPGKDLIIFIHGFPNTSMVWRYLLREPGLLASNANLVAVDLPGFGGSDSMTRYGTQILEYMTEFIVAMREMYGTGGDSIGSTFVVGHDWGCLIGMRLAAEAPCLADRFILTNGPLPELAKSNIERALISARRIFKQFQVSPRNNFGCLSKSFNTIKPVLKQLLFSGYVFAFQLPAMFVKPLGESGNLSFLKACYRAEHRTSRDEYKPHASMAANLGPSTQECKTKTQKGGMYGPSVLKRSRTVGDIFWHTTSYYRDGLALDSWEKSIETIAALYNLDNDMSSSQSPSRRRSSSAASGLFNDQLKGGLHSSVTVVWGEDDVALTKTICLDGISDYLTKESEVILLPGSGHWLPIERESRKVLAQVIGLLANGNSKQAPAYIATEVQKFHSGATLIAKR